MKGLEEYKPKGEKKLRVRFAPITKDNIGQFRRLNLSIFPVRYNDKFYRDLIQGDTINNDNELIRLAYHSDMLVGAMACRLEDIKTNEEPPPQVEKVSTKKGKKSKQSAEDPKEGPKKCYIMTLGVLAPYRKYGVGNQLLNHIIEHVKAAKNVNEIYLHVQINNDKAIEFYKKAGFTIVETLKNYYKKIEPADCYILGRTFDPSEKKLDGDEKKADNKIVEKV